MKKSIILLSCVTTISSTCAAQTLLPSPPMVKALGIDPPKQSGSLEYCFPVEVTSALNRLFNMSFKEDACLLMSYDLDTVSLTVIQFGKPIAELHDSTWRHLLSSTNRHWKYREYAILIYFNSDMRFSYVNWAVTGGQFVRFVSRNCSDVNAILLELTW